MSKSKPDLYVHGRTGEIVTAHKFQAVMLPKEYRKVRFTKNSKGERVMRIELNGAIVDIQENKEAAINGNSHSK